MLFNNAINLLLGLKDLRDSGRDSALAIVTVGYSDLIGDYKMVVFMVFLNDFSDAPGLHLFNLARGPL